MANATVDIPAKQVHVLYYDSFLGLDKMKEVLEKEDYPVESVQV